MLDIYQEYSNHIQEIFENSFDYIYLHDKNGNIIDVNNVVVRNLGYSKKEILNMKVTDFLVEESKPEIIEIIKTTLKTGIVNRPKTYKVRKKNGEFLFVEANAIPLRQNGKFYAILGIGHNVSESKKVEQGLIISEKKYRHLFNHSPFSILLFNAKGNLIESNGILSQKISSYIGGEFQGKNFIEIASRLQNSKQIIKLFSERLKILRQGEDLDPLEFYITPMNGKKIWLYWQSSRFEIDNQTYIQVIIQDVTDRKEVESKLKKQSEDLSTLNKVISLGNESTSLQEFLYKSYDRVLESVRFDRGGVYLYNPKTQHNNLVHHKNVHPNFVAAVEDVNISEGIFSEVFHKEVPYYIEDFSQFMENSKNLGVHSAVIVPLRSKDIYVGSLNLGSPVQQRISQNELELLIAIGKQMGIIIQKFESEKLLLESEEKFRSLFEKADQGIILADIDSEQIISANHKICEMLGYTLEEIKKLRIADLHPNESLHYIDEQSKQEIDEYSLVNDLPMKKKDGGVFYCNVNSSQIEIANQSYFLGFFSDVTKRMEAEQKLKESEEKFKALFKGSPLPTLTWQKIDKDLQLIDYNKALLEYSQEDIRNYLGSNASVFFRNRPDILEELYRCFEKKISITKEIRYFINVIKEEREFLAKFAYIPPDLVLLYVDDITERKESDRKLKESEEKFRSIAEYSDAEISIIQDGVFKYTNQKVLNTVGYTIEEIELWKPNEFVEILIHPNERELVLKLVERIQSGDKDYMFHEEIHVLDKTGKGLWLDMHARFITFQGSPAVLTCSLNITDKKKAEEELKESEKILRDFIHNATDSISIWDSNLNLIEMNEAASDPWTPTKRTEVGMNMLEMAPSMKNAERYQKYLEVIKTGVPNSFDNIRIPPNTGERHFNIKSFKVGNGIGIIGNEITERIRFEQELKESEEKFRTIAEQSFMGIIITQNGKLKYINKALANMSQYPLEEMLNWSDKEIAKMIHPDDVEYILKRLQSNREGTMSQLSQNSFRIFNKSGEIRWLEDYTSKIIYQGREANLISVMDVTDKKQAERLIIEENKRLLELEELRKDLITRVSHELKTPMTSIFGTIQILLSIFREKLDTDALQYVKIGYRGCLRLKELIDNLLDSSRLESKKFELKLQKTDLALLIDDCINDMSYLADTRKQAIDVNTPYRIDFEIDQLRFRQVLTNIISNAIKNTPRGGNIIVNLSEEDEYIEIQVKDNGVGITQKEQEILFEKFGKIERYGKDLNVDIEGSGLGLYISKEIVELHGGKILVVSEGRNKGTTFIIRLFKI